MTKVFFVVFLRENCPWKYFQLKQPEHAWHKLKLNLFVRHTADAVEAIRYGENINLIEYIKNFLFILLVLEILPFY